MFDFHRADEAIKLGQEAGREGGETINEAIAALA